MIVTAELRSREKRALVLGKAKPDEATAAKAKEIEVAGQGLPVLGVSTLRLLEWMSRYYMAQEGLVLKTMFGEELFRKRRAATRRRPAAPQVPPGEEKTSIDKDLLAAFLGQGEGFRTTLLHAPSTLYERSFIAEAVKGRRGVIVLVPEVSKIPHFEAALRPVLGERLAVLHGELKRSERLSAYDRILSGEADAVLGTRMAVFAPLELSMIVVAGEESRSYKNEKFVRFNARDVAIKRASFEGARVLIASICPSAESYNNALTGKYGYLKTTGLRPRVKLVNMRRSKLQSPSVSKHLYDALSRTLKKGGQALVVANRLGHSVPACEDCGFVERCPYCQIALVLHKPTKTLRCHYCGYLKTPPESCPRCGGHGVRFLGSGLERVSEEIRALLPAAPFRVETREKEEGSPDAHLFMGTKRLLADHATRSLTKVAGVINPESPLFHPEFRSRERVFQELNYLAGKLSSDGVLFIQTSEPSLFARMKNLDYDRFMQAELYERRMLGYPPFSRIAVITVEGRAERIKLPEVEGISILGPVPKLTRRGKRVLTILVKAQLSEKLREGLREILKGIKAGNVTVDVDPA
jgi:primosomal protein N' (replication factor Y)